MPKLVRLVAVPSAWDWPMAWKQAEMELVGVVDVVPTLALRAQHEAGMYHDLYLVDMARKPGFDEMGIPVTGSSEELLDQVDIAKHFGVQVRMRYVCRVGGRVTGFMSGQELPVVEALRRAAQRHPNAEQEAWVPS